MGSILSPDELKSLLQGLGKGSVFPGKGKRESARDVVAMDFSRPMPDSAKCAAALSPCMKRLSASFAKDLGETMKRKVRLEPERFRIRSSLAFEDLESEAEGMGVLRMEPGMGKIYLLLWAPMARVLVESFMGGSPGDAENGAGKPLTALEQRLLSRSFSLFAKNLKESLGAQGVEQVVPGGFIPLEWLSEINAGSRIYFCVSFRIRVEEVVGRMDLLFPPEEMGALVANEFRKGGPEYEKSRPRWRKKLLMGLDDLDVEIGVTLGRTEIPAQRLMKLSKGDVILLENSSGDKLLASVEGVPKFLGEAGTSRGKQAIKIASRLGGA